jgi:branched-chain amino acid transport system ATP-binding protein
MQRQGGSRMAILEVSNLVKRFGGLVAVHDLDMTVNEGETLGLIGPNGAGKTTLFNMIAGYYRPDKGQVIFQDDDITGLKPYEVCRRGIGRTFQTTKPFLDISILENAVIGGFMQAHSTAEARKAAQDALDMLELGDRADTLGNALTVPDRKRLEIARALATGAKLLLLDEPMAGLTPSEKVHVSELLRKINGQGITLVIVEHDMKVVMTLCSRIMLMDRGEKLVEGSPQEVSSDPRAITAYLGEEYTA